MTTATLLALGLASVSPVFPQPPPGPALGKAEPSPHPIYDLSREATLQGTVIEVGISGDGRLRMVTLTLQADPTAWRVLAGPEGLLNRLNVAFAVGDSLSILGAPMAGLEGRIFLARRVTKGSVVVNLLDAQGRPALGGR